MGFKIKKIKHELHVPVDSRIIELAKKLDVKIPYEKAWSKWRYENYITFQKALRRSEGLNGKTPIEWEIDVWPN